MTAVEFLIEQLDFLNRERKENLIDAETYFKHKISLVQQAKEMEKQQIIDAYIEGYSSNLNAGDSEKYYNETYKKPYL
jgi:hypothetical protein